MGLSVAKLGNIRSQTLRGSTAAEMEKILDVQSWNVMVHHHS
jgi:uncharacterized protein with GYD domain